MIRKTIILTLTLCAIISIAFLLTSYKRKDWEFDRSGLYCGRRPVPRSAFDHLWVALVRKKPGATTMPAPVSGGGQVGWAMFGHGKLQKQYGPIIGRTYTIYHWPHPAHNLGYAVHEAKILDLPIWMMLLVIPLLSIYPLYALTTGPLRLRYRRKKGLCLRCGYNLTGNVSGVCPECGERI